MDNQADFKLMMIPRHPDIEGAHSIPEQYVIVLKSDYYSIWPKEKADKSDAVNHPSHYTDFPVEAIDMMFKIWGKELVIAYCEMNAFKYRMRAGKKRDALEDLKKADKYMEFKQNMLKYLAPTGDQLDWLEHRGFDMVGAKDKLTSFMSDKENV